MKNKFRDKRRKKNISIVFWVIRFAFLLCSAILIGMLSGNILSNIDINKVLQKIDIEAYKSVMDNSLPIIGTVYNNGNISTSISGGINDLIKQIFSFDIDNPISILNAQSAVLYSYYDTGYLPHQANNKKDKTEDSKTDNKTDSNKDTEIADNSVPGDNNSGGLEEAASSISTNDVEKEEPSKGDVDSNGKITIQNETKYKVNIDELMKEPLKFKFDKRKDKVLIYHTHTTESYLTNISQLNSFVSTRSRDPRHSVVRVGEELAENLRKKFGMQVIHNATIHDYPDYNSSYSNSLKTVTAILKAYPNIKIVIDLHRDAVGDNKKLREVANVNGKNDAKIMFVIATGEVKQNHPTWKENLKLALKIQEKLNEQCPQLTLPINLAKYTYNQHVSNGALLIEIGGDGNLLDECLESTKYLSKAINDVVNK